jgi:hypothetical protein
LTTYFELINILSISSFFTALSKISAFSPYYLV